MVWEIMVTRRTKGMAQPRDRANRDRHSDEINRRRRERYHAAKVSPAGYDRETSRREEQT
jgi:hypothetical protein